MIGPAAWRMFSARWNSRGNRCPGAGNRFDGEISADHFDPFSHAKKSEMFSIFGQQRPFNIERFAVIFDRHANAVGQLLNIHVRAAGFGVTLYVVERLLRNSKQDRAPGGVQIFNPRKSGQSGVNPRSSAKALDRGMQSGN